MAPETPKVVGIGDTGSTISRTQDFWNAPSPATVGTADPTPAPPVPQPVVVVVNDSNSTITGELPKTIAVKASDVHTSPPEGEAKAKGPAFDKGEILPIGVHFFQVVRINDKKLFLAPKASKIPFNPKMYPRGAMLPLKGYAFQIVDHSARHGMCLRLRGALHKAIEPDDTSAKDQNTP